MNYVTGINVCNVANSGAAHQNAVHSSAAFLNLQPLTQPFLHLHENSSQQGFDALSSLVHTQHPCLSPFRTGWQEQCSIATSNN